MKNDKKKLNESLGLIAKTSVFVFIGAIFAKVFSYIYRMVIARYFDAETYGLFSLALMITGLVVVFCTLGLTQGISRFVAFYRGRKENEKVRHIINKSFVFLLVMGLIVGILVYVLSGFISLTIFHNPGLIIYLKIFSIAIPLTVLMNFFLSILQGYEEIKWYSFIFNFFLNFAKIAILVILIIVGVKSNSVPISYLAAIAISLALSLIIAKRVLNKEIKEEKLNKSLKEGVMNEMFAYSIPMMFSGLIESLLYWTDSFMIGYFINVESVGYYNAAVPLVLLFALAPEIFMQLFFPLITKAYGEKKNSIIKELGKQVNKWIFIVNLPFLILVFTFPGAFINAFFGQEYLVAENALRILSIGAFFVSLSVVGNKLLGMKGKSKLILRNTAIATIINVILNALLIPKYGINGAAFATTISLTLLSVLFFIQVKSELDIIPIRRKMFRILFVSILSVVLLLIAKRFILNVGIIELIVIAIIFVLVYLVILIATSCLDEHDWEILNMLKETSLKGIEKIYK